MDVEANLKDSLQRVEQLLADVEAQVKRAGPGREETVLVQVRPQVYQAVTRLGESIAALAESGVDEAVATQLRAGVADWLYRWSVSSPIFARMQDLARGIHTYHELLNHVRAMRSTGASISAMVFNDYYLHARSTQAGRNRLSLLGEVLAREVNVRREGGRDRVDVLCLQYIGGLEWEQVFQDPELSATVNLTCIDGSTEGARHARQALSSHPRMRIHVKRSDPLPYLEAPHHLQDAFDIVYCLSLMDRLTDIDAGRLIRGAARWLRPGGVLIAGGLTNDVPLGEQMLHRLMVSWDWRYRDEHAWRSLLWGAPFALDAARFEREALGLALLVTVIRE